MKKTIVLVTAAALSFMVSCSDDDSATQTELPFTHASHSRIKHN